MGSGRFLLVLVACDVRAPAAVPVPLPLPPPVAVEPMPPEPALGATVLASEDVIAEAPAAASPDVAVYALRRGESLAHFARWSELPVEIVAEHSGLSLDDLLPVGTDVRIPLDAEGRARLEANRDGHHLRRAEGYLASRGGSLGTEFHRVRTGESAWSVAKDNAIPVWLLEVYNPSVDLEHLRPGMDLMLPIVADSVAAAVTAAELEPGWQ